jgi:hypothetical protein
VNYRGDNRNSGKPLAVLGNATADGAGIVQQVVQCSANNGTSRQWQLVPA